MATPSRPEDPDVSRAVIRSILRDDPWSFQFFQAVRLLERIYPHRLPVGRFGPPEREVVRFGVHNSLTFPPSQIHGIDWREDEPPRMRVNFFGLTGPLGVLPHAYSELVRNRNRARDRTLEEFLDIFHHRLISFFYQAWEKYRFPVAYERDQDDRFSGYLMHLVGIGTEGLQDRQAVSDQALLFYTGLLALQPRSGSALEQIIADYFDVPVEIEEFVGAWYPLESDNQCSLDTGLEFSEQLGLGAVAGDAIWDQQSRVRIKLGPLKLTQYLDFLPQGRAHEPLRSLTRFFSGAELQFEVQLILDRNEVPRCELGAGGDAAPQLGWTSWMKSAPVFDRDPGETTFLLT